MADAVELSDRVCSRPSPIHGQGCFALVGIDSGDFIGTFEGDRVRRDADHVLWVSDGERSVGIRGNNVLRYLNHSDRPNAAFDGFELYAVDAIAAGDEITIDYQPDR